MMVEYRICRSDIYTYFNVNFNVLFKLIKVHLLVSELYLYQNERCNDKKNRPLCSHISCLQKLGSITFNTRTVLLGYDIVL